MRPGYSQIADAVRLLGTVEIRAAQAFAVSKVFLKMEEALSLLSEDSAKVTNEPVDPSPELSVGTEPPND